MIEGTVTPDGVPQITLYVADRGRIAVIDTGFNGFLELPSNLQDQVNAVYQGRVRSSLAGGKEIEEVAYLVEFPFDGRRILAEATFVDAGEILIGTRMLDEYRLSIDFPARTVRLTRVEA